MEYKKDPLSGRFVMVEPTVGRTDWQSAIADINGVPIPYVAYCDMIGASLPEIRRTKRRYKWVRWSADKAAASQYRAEGKLRFATWLWSIRPPRRWAVWSFADPLPWLHAQTRRTFRKVVKVASAVSGRGSSPAGDT